VLARTGQTVILGGLITKDLEEDTRRIPYLADIPVLGRLFRYDQVSNKRTELLIILTPYLVTSPEQIDWINAREGQRMSWCLADLVNIHGPVPFSGNPMFNASPTPLIFPDLDPNGYPSGPDPYGSIPSFPPPGVTPQPTLQPLNVPSSSGYPSGPAPYNSPVSPTPAAPTPVPPGPPVGTSVPPPPPSPGLGYQQDAPPSNNYIVPQPPSLIPPAASSHGGSPLGPPSIEPVSPPAGTTRRLFPGPLPAGLPFGPSVAPAHYQQPASQ
jgi:general secretion pathway protein D